MAEITDITENWSAGITLAADETWQARSGWILLSTDAAPTDAGAILLRGNNGDSVDLSSGKTVKYKSVIGMGIPHLVRQAL